MGEEITILSVFFVPLLRTSSLCYNLGMLKDKFTYFGPEEDFDSVQWWQSRPAEERIRATWQLVEDAWALKGRSKDELRLQRTTILFKRQKS